eukprot:CAMPEP_0174696582 /NCGR_PEP_ID=MMETSP1094-20130205/2696_1 /TAXON_ID=156173 /ORGANISM="Chrysochromulina brevifilum, Strain UTEX LB 985" /LENGTH=58 /DNA_ID=CAMNT_0015893391 /DNA_START=361 /DNA_END=537 /DNA_ORIENTATION=-
MPNIRMLPRDAVVEGLHLAIGQDHLERAVHKLDLLQPVGEVALDLAIWEVVELSTVGL